jgi:hypothetical protein
MIIAAGMEVITAHALVLLLLLTLVSQVVLLTSLLMDLTLTVHQTGDYAPQVNAAGSCSRLWSQLLTTLLTLCCCHWCTGTAGKARVLAL